MFTAYEEFKEEVEHEEGRRHTAYRDSLGKLTIGVGHLIPAAEIADYGPDVSVTDDQIDTWLDEDIATTLAGARRHFPAFDTYNTELQLGIMQWLYQLGPDAPNKFPSAKRYLNEGKYREAGLEMIYANPKTKRHSAWYTQTPARCQRQADRVMAGGGSVPPDVADPAEIADTLEAVAAMLRETTPDTAAAVATLTDVTTRLRDGA